MLSVYFLYVLAFALIMAIVALVYGLQKLRTNLRTVAQELERCQLTLEISEDVGRFGSWHLNVATNIVKWSDYVFDMHERKHSLGDPKLDQAIDYYHPTDRPIVESAVQLAIEQGEDFEFRARIITEQGNELPVLARGTCQIGMDGNVLGIFGCFVDLSSPEDRYAA